MKRMVFAAVAPWCLALCLAATAVGSSAEPVPMDPVVIAVPDSARLKKPRVRFPHARHVQLDGKPFDCAACHHEWKGEGDVKKCTEAGCHAGTGKKQPMYFRNAFHGKSAISCNGCHGRRRAEDKSHGPTSCGDCHKAG